MQARRQREDDPEINMLLLGFKKQIMEHFGQEEWQDIALLTNSTALIDSHPRLLRSLSFGDEDYGGHVVEVLRKIVNRDLENVNKIQKYLDVKYGDGGEFVSSVPSERRITFAPNVFKVPDLPLRSDLVAVMMPFAMEYNDVYKAIKRSAENVGFECLRADDIWRDSTFMQDIFDLIFQSTVVISDFSNRNPNVMYETGIAHCLGRTVVPISQSPEHIPSDLRHHRTCIYHNNSEGHSKLEIELGKRLRTLSEE